MERASRRHGVGLGSDAIFNFDSHLFPMDCKKIATEVYELAGQESDPLAPLIKEALEVIDQCLDTHGWVLEQYFSSGAVI